MWSLTVARVYGTAVRIHVTFLLFLVWIWYAYYRQGGTSAAWEGVIFVSLLFFCVLLHEFGHVFAARRYGVKTPDITLWPFGGIASLERIPDKPWQEFVVAIAGPLVNVAIAAALIAYLGFTSVDVQSLARIEDPKTSMIVKLAGANIFLVLFNLIPAFPMDGGRVLRALLWMVMGFGPATRIATLVGQVAAVGLGLWGLLSGNLFLALIAVFVFLGAGQERADEQARVVLGTLRVGDAYNKHAIALAPGDTVGSVADYILTSYQPDFAVLQGGALLGVVTRADVLQSLATETHDSYVTGVMKRDVLRVEADAPLDSVRRLLVEKGERVAAVTRGGTYLGLVSLEDIAEALLVVAFRAAQDTRRKAVETA